jgi:hypothetical protein
MPETGGFNIEVARHLNEEKEHQASSLYEMLEIVEAIVLALAAVATAWSGYQAARWDSQQSQFYGQSTRLRVEAQGLSTRSDQERAYDAANVVEWLKAKARHEDNLADLFERRFLPDFRPAFEAWKRTDPIHNSNAPSGPAYMPEYRNPTADRAAELNQEASNLFERGTRARERGDDYVRITVTLATVLLLIAISQKFRIHKVRLALIVIACLLLCFPLWHLLTLPRA